MLHFTFTREQELKILQHLLGAEAARGQPAYAEKEASIIKHKADLVKQGWQKEESED